MGKLLHISFPEIVVEERLDSNPVLVYLSTLAPKSRRTMQGSLDAIAMLVSGGKCRALDFEWQRLRYQHTTAIRAALLNSDLSPATSNRHLNALRRVLKECLRLELMDANDYAKAIDLEPIRGYRVPAGRSLSPQEVEALVRVCVEDDSPTGKRDAALVTLARLGLRRTEIIDAEYANYHQVDGTLKIRGKGNKERLVPIPERGRELMNCWLSIRGNEPGPLLLPVNRGSKVMMRRLTSQSVLYVLTNRAKEANIDKFSPHDLRRTCAGDLLDAGVDIVTVQHLLGHAKVDTTAKYDRRGESAKIKAVKLLNW